MPPKNPERSEPVQAAVTVQGREAFTYEVSPGNWLIAAKGSGQFYCPMRRAWNDTSGGSWKSRAEAEAYLTKHADKPAEPTAAPAEREGGLPSELARLVDIVHGDLDAAIAEFERVAARDDWHGRWYTYLCENLCPRLIERLKATDASCAECERIAVNLECEPSQSFVVATALRLGEDDVHRLAEEIQLNLARGHSVWAATTKALAPDVDAIAQKIWHAARTSRITPDAIADILRAALSAQPASDKDAESARLQERLAEVERERSFPIQSERGAKPHPLSSPWSVAELAYSVYSGHYGRSQSLETLARRGGFGPGEMDMYLPDWRERCDQLAAARREAEEMTRALREIAERTIHFSEIDVVDENWRQRRAREALATHTPGATT